MFLAQLLFALCMALLFTLVFAIGLRRPRPKVETISQVEKEEAAAERTFDVFFWVLLIGLAAVVVLGYVRAART